MFYSAFNSLGRIASSYPLSLFLDVRRVTSFLCIKNTRNTCRHLRYNQTFGWISSVQWRKVVRIWRIQLLFHRFLCVRIKIVQLQCMNCWVIIHCLSVSSKQINHSCLDLVIWSPLQLTSKQWIIIQTFTARADLFLKQSNLVNKISGELLEIGSYQAYSWVHDVVDLINFS